MHKNITNIGLDAANTNDNPIVQKKHDHLEVRLPKHFRDQGWANSMGFVQDEIHRFVTETVQSSRKMTFDFESCRWIDPLPLMSILLEIANSRHSGMSITIRLPEPDKSLPPFEKIPYQESPNRLLWFLAQEGFLDCIIDLNDKEICFPSKSGKELQSIYRKLDVKPSYEDARCIPLHLFNVPVEEQNDDFAQNSVESLLIGVDTSLESKVAPQTRERLIYKLRVALQEALHNVQEHAYIETESPRLIALYVRYRTGGLGLDSVSKRGFYDCVNEERNHCPQLDKDWLTSRIGCLEVFVLDRGIGMVKSFERVGIKLTGKFKFKEVMLKTFYDGHSTKPERQTRYGGLHLLYNLLLDTGDYIRALETGIWFGTGVPLYRRASAIHNLTETQAQMKGLAMHFRLGWKKETDQGDKWLMFKQLEKSEVWLELSLSENSCSLSFNWFDKQLVIDERFGELKTYGSYSGWILWLVRPHRMKWDIISFIERNITPHVSDQAMLIIADIASYEAETYAAALDGYKAPGTTDWPSKFKRIILSTNRWSFAAIDYQKQKERHGFSSLHKRFTDISIAPPPIEPRPVVFRLAIVRWLKWHDSRRFWDEVSKRRQMFIPEQISWGNDKLGKTVIMKGYLDFPQTTYNGLCVAIYRAALSRIFGILPPDRITMYSLDRLTMTVLREIRAKEVYESAPTALKRGLSLGSVLVLGSTLDASTLREFDLHFFVHCSSPLRGYKPSILFWMPKAQVSGAQPRLSRIGKTASIAPEGWKSFEIPRFDEKGQCIGARNPQDSYRDWQNPSPVIVKAGHWAYEGHHDFLTVNIASAVEAAFLAKGPLAAFLMNAILHFIGLNKEHIDKNWHRLLEDRLFNKSAPNSSTPNDGLLVYRSHPSSESVVRRLLNILTPKGRALVLTRIFPILPIRMRWSGSTLLIPPLIREDIRKALFLGNKVHPILLFDDAAITGRTLHDLRAAISAIGATQISTLVIANRLRQPADGRGKAWVNYYWRLDLPVIGRDGNCPLCHTLHMAEAFSSSLAATLAKEEIRGWRTIWGETAPLDNWSVGLRPLPLVNLGKGTKYCYRPNLNKATCEEEKYLARIDLVRSTGLAIHVAELHAMTGRDDYCLKKINEHSEPEIRVELAASQLLLFGHEFDMDIRVELVKVLIRELARLKEGSPHAPLAALTTMGGLDLLDKDSKRQAISSIQDDVWELDENYVTRVLLAYLVSENLIDESKAAFKKGKNLLTTTSWTLAQRFNDWFLETLSPHGNAHSEAIPLVINELTEATEISDLLIKDAIGSMDHLADIIDRLERALVRKEGSAAFAEKLATMKKTDETVRDLLQKLANNRTDDWHLNARLALEKYIKDMKSVADGYFHRIPSASEYWRNSTFETKGLSQVIDGINWGSFRNECG